jgi:hypothetical protein
MAGKAARMHKTRKTRRVVAIRHIVDWILDGAVENLTRKVFMTAIQDLNDAR